MVIVLFLNKVSCSNVNCLKKTCIGRLFLDWNDPKQGVCRGFNASLALMCLWADRFFSALLLSAMKGGFSRSNKTGGNNISLFAF